MRHLQVRVARGHGGQVAEIAHKHDIVDVTCWEATSSEEGDLDVVSIQAENRAVGPILKGIQDVPKMSATLYPHEILTFEPPAHRAPSKLKNLENRSPIGKLKPILSIRQFCSGQLSFICHSIKCLNFSAGKRR